MYINTQSNYTPKKNFYQLKLPIITIANIDANDPLHTLLEVAQEISFTPLMEQYSSVGRNPLIEPYRMFVLIIYSYMNGIYSSREIEALCKRDLYYMYIVEERHPEHSTINRFRQKLFNCIEPIFNQFIQLLIKRKDIKLTNLFIDGTKIEANANKYSFVWKTKTIKNQAKIVKNINEILESFIKEYQIEEDNYFKINKIEIKDDEIVTDEKKVNEYLTRLMNYIMKNTETKGFVSGQGKRKTEKQRIYELIVPGVIKYQMYSEYLKIIGDSRNSMSKIDHDATFMHLKEDYMKNGQLKPGYNVQFANEGHFIVGLDVNMERNDANCLIPMVEKINKNIKLEGTNIVADSGYYSEKNYAYLEENNYKNYVKPNLYEKLKTRKYQKYNKMNYEYNEKEDYYLCPNKEKFIFQKIVIKKKKEYESVIRQYLCTSCANCPLNEKCNKGKETKRIEMNPKLNRLTAIALKNLRTELGAELRMNRSIQAEGIFAILKEDYNFKRFYTRGIENVTGETYIIAFALNVMNLYRKITKNKDEVIYHPLKLEYKGRI